MRGSNRSITAPFIFWSIRKSHLDHYCFFFSPFVGRDLGQVLRPERLDHRVPHFYLLPPLFGSVALASRPTDFTRSRTHNYSVCVLALLLLHVCVVGVMKLLFDK